MKKTLPIALGSLVGLYMVCEYFIPHPAVRDISARVLEWGGLIAAGAYVIGGIHLVQVTWPTIRRRQTDWQYKIALLASAAIMAIVGLPWRSILHTSDETGSVVVTPHAATSGKATVVLDTPDDVVVTVGAITTTSQDAKRFEVDPGELPIKAGRNVVGYDSFETKQTIAAGDEVTIAFDPQMRWGANGRFRTWIYDHIFAPCNATMFALLAFFVASAAFRAFRARNAEAALLLGSAIVILLATAPFGRAIWSSLPDVAQWILDIPSNGSRRAIIMGAAVGAIATGLRVILGIERSHLGGD